MGDPGTDTIDGATSTTIPPLGTDTIIAATATRWDRVPGFGAGLTYQTGTWTPVIGGATSTSGQSYTTQIGTYTRIGRLVVAHYEVTLSNKGTITGDVQLQGFPFAPSGEAVWMQAYWDQLSTTVLTFTCRLFGGGTVAALYKLSAAATASYAAPMQAADVSNTTRLLGTVVYEV
jgi:hypothetical protein